MSNARVSPASWADSALIAALALLDSPGVVRQIRDVLSHLTRGESRILLSRLTLLPPADALAAAFLGLPVAQRQCLVGELAARYRATGPACGR